MKGNKFLNWWLIALIVITGMALISKDNKLKTLVALWFTTP